MAKIVFSLSGEGRGHATRVRTVVEALRCDHSIAILAPGDAYDFLAPLYADTEIEVRRIPGMRFHYDARRRLDFSRTTRGALTYLRDFPHLFKEIDTWLEKQQPDLAIVDFEPSLPRVAKRRGIPFVSLTHQHFLLTYDLKSLPFQLRAHVLYMRAVVRSYYSGQCHSIVSSFYFPSLRKGCRNVTQVGVLLRPEIREAVPTAEEHLVAYLRRFAGRNVMDALAAAGRPVRVYGLGERPPEGRLTFHAVCESRFVKDLASCAALVATAGNQLVGEALFLGKPCFVMPEARNFEQYINAHFLELSGSGASTEMEKVTPGALLRFLSKLETFAARVDRRKMDGLPGVLHTLKPYLASRQPAAALRPEPLPGLVPELSA